MIKQITGFITFNQNESDYIETLKPFEGKKWELRQLELSRLKDRIREQLNKTHNEECAYCGNPLYVTSGGQIEHIAPKGVGLHPEFMFTSENLALSCQHCNGFSKKGTFDTILKKDKMYSKCEFKIVHPYYDNPGDHYEFTDTVDKILIKFKTRKGEESIRLFDLDGEKQTIARATQVRYLALINQYKLNEPDENLVRNGITHK